MAEPRSGGGPAAAIAHPGGVGGGGVALRPQGGAGRAGRPPARAAPDRHADEPGGPYGGGMLQPRTQRPAPAVCEVLDWLPPGWPSPVGPSVECSFA